MSALEEGMNLLKDHNAILVLTWRLRLSSVHLIGLHMDYSGLTMLAIGDHHQVF